MGLFDRIRKKNAIQIDPVDTTRGMFQCGWDYLGIKRNQRPFAAAYLWMCLQQLYNGVSNITFETTRGKSVIADSICSFLDSNASLMLSKYLNSGFVAVSYDKDHNYWLPQDTKLQFDSYGRVINRNTVVIYGPSYQTQRKSPMLLCKPLLDLIGQLSNTLVESCGTMGVLPIISGSSIPANPKFKQELAEMMSKNYGWDADQLRYFLSQQELKVDEIDLKIKDLELRDNVLSAFKSLLNFFEVPVDLVVGNSKYANVEAARRYFYDSTVRKYAEVFLKVGRNLLTASEVFLPQSTITYRLTNVSGLETTLSDTCKEKTAYVDLLIKLREAGVVGVTEELERVYADIKKDYITV